MRPYTWIGYNAVADDDQEVVGSVVSSDEVWVAFVQHPGIPSKRFLTHEAAVRAVDAMLAGIPS